MKGCSSVTALHNCNDSLFFCLISTEGRVYLAEGYRNLRGISYYLDAVYKDSLFF